METHIKTVEFERPSILSDVQSGASCVTHAWAKVPPVLSHEERGDLKVHIKRLLKEREAVLVAYYYVDVDLQGLAGEIGGYVSGSLEMARFGHDHPAETLIAAGVRFMGETAKTLSPEKTVLMPDLDATYSLDLGYPLNEFATFCGAHPDRTMIVYANTSTTVKARADWMVTSSIGLKIMQHLHAQEEKILWVPDRHLGSYTQRQTGADILMWQGSCLVHDEFKGAELDLLHVEHPNVKILVHPELPELMATQADVMDSASQLIAAAQSLSMQKFIIVTGSGVLRRMRMATPGKCFIEAPTAGNAATYESCTHCPWMAMNALTNLAEMLETGRNEIRVSPAIGRQTMVRINHMLDFTARKKAAVRPQGDLATNAQLFQGIGPA